VEVDLMGGLMEKRKEKRGQSSEKSAVQKQRVHEKGGGKFS